MKRIGRLFIIGLFCLTAVQFGMPLNPDQSKKIDERVEQLLKQMTTDEKIGQMTQAERAVIKHMEDINTYNLGSLLSGGGSGPQDNSPSSWFDMVDEFQKITQTTRLKIPLLYGIDAVHGHNNVRPAVIFPHNIGLGCTRDSKLVEMAARATAEEVAGTGIKWTFAPCVAIARNIRWGRTYESFGENPELVSEMGAAVIRGLQGTNLSDTSSIIACAKHFVGDGGTTDGINEGNTECTEKELRDIYLPPYQAAIKEGVKTIMVSFSSWNGTKMHANKYLLTDVLKNELKFEGFVISDWGAVQKLPGKFPEQVTAAINAGIDMVMVPIEFTKFVDTMRELIADKKIPMDRIDDAVRRILRVKVEAGLMDKPFMDRTFVETVGSDEHRKIARQCVRESLVLLKNDKKTLPLSKNIKKLVIVGKIGDNLGAQCGGWTITWQGWPGETTVGNSILQSVQKALPGAEIDYSFDGSDIKPGNELAICVVGEMPYAETKGDRKNLALEADDMTALANIKKNKLPVVTILISGRPMIITDALKRSDAFIAAWLPGTEGQGIADVLFGDYKPTGKLSFTWPNDMKQISIHYGDKKGKPLFEYGYGLTY